MAYAREIIPNLTVYKYVCMHILKKIIAATVSQYQNVLHIALKVVPFVWL